VPRPVKPPIPVLASTRTEVGVPGVADDSTNGASSAQSTRTALADQRDPDFRPSGFTSGPYRFNPMRHQVREVHWESSRCFHDGRARDPLGPYRAGLGASKKPNERRRGFLVLNAIVLYHSLSALASAEVNFWFTCRRKRLVARPADGCGERCRMTFSATWASAYI
jgi:hypothetical protein